MSDKKVKLFSTPTCPWCDVAKQYLESKEIPFETIDVTQDNEQAILMVQKSGQQGVPQLWIGDDVVIGFNKPEIDRLLEIS